MKISIVQGAFFPVPPLRGGAVEKIWFALGREFARQGHEVTHISRAFANLPPEEVADNVRYLRIAGHDAPRSLITLKALDLCYSFRVIRKLPPADILVTHTFWLPILVRSRRFGRLYVHVARYPKGQMRWYQHAARLQTVSRPIEQAIAAEAPWCRERITCIPNPLPEFPDKPAIADPARKRLLFVGRIHPEKGLHLLLAAIGLIPNANFSGWKLIVVGPSEVSAGGGGHGYLARLRSICAEFQDRVDWAGPIYDPAQLATQYRSASLFVYPSLAERGETFGLAPLEAMSHGCPALVSDLACFGDFIEDGVNGFVFDHRAPGAESALSKKLAALLSDPGCLRSVRSAAAARAGEYTVERIAALYLRDFESLCASTTTAQRENIRPEIAV